MNHFEPPDLLYPDQLSIAISMKLLQIAYEQLSRY